MLPQMSPMNWFILFMYFSILFTYFMIMNYYLMKFSIKNNKMIKSNLINWKW
uniref:ATP synthase complex subunit 8 n=1 Tax=Scydmaeninae sp. BMNH 1274313 TaxID=1796549 RepID=A0A126TFE1_9COLE|nr:ATP synthase F0 subunit 8 [Scydmaeninae sp. BMNH 1274313]